jgi:tetratricopeptide (TPR) repeat protein
MLLGQREPDEAPHDRELAAEVERVGELRRQRRFDEALSLLASIASRRPNRDNLDLQMIRFRILSDTDRDQEAVMVLYQMLAANPELGTDLSFLESLAIHELASGQAQEALKTIGQCERVAGQNVPIYVALKAQALVSAGRVVEADLAIDHLKRIDPSHPLIKERQSVARIGNTYVQKKDAASASCILCVLLECIFDCI